MQCSSVVRELFGLVRDAVRGVAIYCMTLVAPCVSLPAKCPDQLANSLPFVRDFFHTAGERLAGRNHMFWTLDVDLPTRAHVPRLDPYVVRPLERKMRSSHHIRVFIINETTGAGIRLTVYVSFAKASALVVPSVPEDRDTTRGDPDLSRSASSFSTIAFAWSLLGLTFSLFRSLCLPYVFFDVFLLFSSMPSVFLTVMVGMCLGTRENSAIFMVVEISKSFGF